jgi:hypothetical protein
MSGENNIEYAERYYSENPDQVPVNGDIVFIPSGVDTFSHDEMVDLMLNKQYFNCAVKINGTTKSIVVHHSNNLKKTITFSSNYEIKDCLSNCMDDVQHELGDNYRILLTGHICVSRGISITSERFYVNKAIYGPKLGTRPANKYQIMSRICGNIKTFSGYQIKGCPQIVCDQRDYNQVVPLYDIINKYHQHKSVDTTLADKLYKECTCGVGVLVKEFNTYEEALSYTLQYNHHIQRKECTDGFYHAVLRDNHGILSYDLILTNSGWGLNKHSPIRVYPCYRDITDPHTLVWVVCQIKQ